MDTSLVAASCTWTDHRVASSLVVWCRHADYVSPTNQSIPKQISYTYTAQFILDGGVHEDTTIEYLQSIGGNIIHAGSGFGDFLPALKDCDKVWVFEPNPLMYESSLETISLNNLVNVEIFPFALGRYNGYSNLKHIDESGSKMQVPF